MSDPYTNTLKRIYDQGAGCVNNWIAIDNHEKGLRSVALWSGPSSDVYLLNRELRDALANLLKESESRTRQACSDACQIYGDGTDAEAEARMLIQSWDESEIPKTQWISVEERLPEEKQEIDAYNLKNNTRGRTRFLSEYMFCGRPWFTHWMPLPAAPTQENQ